MRTFEVLAVLLVVSAACRKPPGRMRYALEVGPASSLKQLALSTGTPVSDERETVALFYDLRDCELVLPEWSKGREVALCVPLATK